MTISTYGDLKTAVADYAKRRDIDARIPDFIQSTHVLLTEYVGALTPLVLDADTNALLQYDPQVYLWGSLHQAGLYLRDDDLMSYYGAKFQARLDDMAFTGIDMIGGSPSQQVV